MAAMCYCDFYSIKRSEENMNEYVYNLKKIISSYKNSGLSADTIYFGGGTPSLLGTERLVSILQCTKNTFGNSSQESTLEVNPESAVNLDFERLRYEGINRVSMGLQSSDGNELKALGRKHTADEVAKAVYLIKKCGISNISLDLMIGISGQTVQSLSNSISFCSELEVSHISAYLLKIEKGTLYYKNRNKLVLPDDDTVCDLYEFMIKMLNGLGYNQYEISNFAKPGKESRHNLKYWNCEEYLGLGPSAHSFLNGKRFFYDRSMRNFYNNITCQDGTGGDEEEYIAMQLRLSNGLQFKKFKAYFGYKLPEKYIENAKKLLKTNFLILSQDGIKLTPQGFLCSNSIIVFLISGL